MKKNLSQDLTGFKNLSGLMKNRRLNFIYCVYKQVRRHYELMIDTINYITDFITHNFLVSFAFYTIIYFLIRLLLKDKSFINRFDDCAIDLMIWVGTFWIALKLVGIFIFLYQLEKEVERLAFTQHLVWFIKNSWFQLFFWALLIQLLRITFLKKSLIYRIIMSLLFVFSFERIDIIIISFNRGHLTSSWPMNLSLFEILIGLTTKIVVFILIVSAYYFGIKRIKMSKPKKQNTITVD